MPTKPPVANNPIDIHVGSLIRARRKALGLSQTELANALGITFQQIQKYERGTNRISASKLYDAAKMLKVEISSFFEGLATLDGDRDPFAAFAGFMALEGAAELAQAYKGLSPIQRRKLVDLAKVMTP